MHDYLVSMPEREHEACRRLVQLPFLSARFFGSLGVHSEFAWFLLQMRKEVLVRSSVGDVDILAGRLDWADPAHFDALLQEERSNARGQRHDSWNHKIAAIRLAQAGGIEWPPSTDHLVAIEAKCARFDPAAAAGFFDQLKSAKSSPSKLRKLRNQVDSLLDMGFDHVALLDMIALPKVSGPDGGAWISALNLATEARNRMFPLLQERLPKDCQAGHWVWSIGSVAGNHELYRGAGAPTELTASRENSRLLTSVKTPGLRRELERKLNALFEAFAAPTSFPAVFVDCKECGKVHAMAQSAPLSHQLADEGFNQASQPS